MLAIEPAEHERRPEHDARDSAFERDLLLRLLAFGVMIDRGRVHHRGADLNHVGNVGLLGGRNQPLRRGDVIGDVGIGVDAADLSVGADQSVGTPKRVLPTVVMGKISRNQSDVRMQLPKDRAVGRMLVDRHDVGEHSRLQPWNEVLADKASRPGHHYAPSFARGESTSLLAFCQSFVRNKIGRGSKRMTAMIGHQKRGV
jgi:hypothetical protein